MADNKEKADFFVEANENEKKRRHTESNSDCKSGSFLAAAKCSKLAGTFSIPSCSSETQVFSPCLLADATLKAEDFAVKDQIREIFFFSLFVIVTTLIVLLKVNASTYFFANAVSDIFTKTPYDWYQVTPFINASQNSKYKRSISNMDPEYLESQAEKLFNMKFPSFDHQQKVKGQQNPKQMKDENLISHGEEAWGLNFENTMTHGHLWRYYLRLLPKLLHLEYWHTEWEFNILGHTEKDDRLSMYSSKILGLPRIHQVRVTHNKSCEVHPEISDLFHNCYGYYYSSTEALANIPSLHPPNYTIDAWEYKGIHVPGAHTFSGKLSTYGPGGFMHDLGNNQTDTENKLRELHNLYWISIATRAVVVDFVIYNPNINVFLICNLLAEMPPTGGVFTSSSFVAYQFLRYITELDFLVLGLEFIFIIFTFSSLGFLILKAVSKKKKILSDVWFYYDIIIIMLAVTCIILNCYRTFVLEDEVLSQINIYNDHVSLHYVASIHDLFESLSSLLLFFMWWKLFKYLALTKTMIHLINFNFIKYYSRIYGFFLYFVIVLLSFALLAFLLFSSDVWMFHNFGLSFITLIMAIVGIYDHKEVDTYHPILAPIFMVVFIFMMFFITMSFLLVFVAECYTIEFSRVIPTNEFTIYAYLKRLCERLRPRRMNPEPGLSVRRVRETLRKANFRDYEIDVFLAKYKVQPTGNITQREARRIVEELHMRKLDFYESEYTPSASRGIRELVNRLEKRIKEIEKKV